MWSPQISASSPVFTMTVRSRGSMIRERPRSSLAAPVPPASAVSFMARGTDGSVLAAGEGGAGAAAPHGAPERGAAPPAEQSEPRPPLELAGKLGLGNRDEPAAHPDPVEALGPCEDGHDAGRAGVRQALVRQVGG